MRKELTTAVTRACDALLGVLLRPPACGPWCPWAIVCGLVSVVGIGDYLTGDDVALSIFYLVPITLATGWCGARAGVAVALLCTLVGLVGDVLSVPEGRLDPHTVWNISAALVISVFIVGILQSLLALHRQLANRVQAQSQALDKSAADRRRLELEILDISARERNAFGRELHDDLGQHLVATALAAQTLAERLGARSEAADARAIVGWIEDGIARTRKLARGLLLGRIEPDRFPLELEELAIASSRGAVTCRVLRQGGKITADASQCAQLYRITQEAVGNALRHARAGRVEISIASDAHALSVAVEDDGCGLGAAATPNGGMGLRIMQHRARIIGASLSLFSQPGKGTRMVCRLPRGEYLQP
jgi:signal transduction histidine kinase